MLTIASFFKKSLSGFALVLIWVLPVLFCTLLSGCLTFRQSLVFQQDLTCIATYDYALPQEYVPLLKESGKILGEISGSGTALTFFLEETAVCDYFNSLGLEVRQYRQIKEGGLLRVQIIVLARDGAKATANGAFGNFQLTKDVLGDWHLRSVLSSLPSNLDSSELARWQNLCRGSNLTLEITAPTAIIRSNGRITAFNRVSWQYSWPATEAAESLFQPAPPPELEVVW